MTTGQAEGQLEYPGEAAGRRFVSEAAGRRFAIGVALLGAAILSIAWLAIETSPETPARLQGISLVAWAVVAVIVAAGLAVVGVIRFGGEGYLACLWVFAPVVPAFGAGVSVVAYLLAGEASDRPGVPANPGDAVVIGIGATALAWAALAFPASALATRRRAQMRAYDELVQRSGVLEARVHVELLKSRDADDRPVTKALDEAKCRIEAVARELTDDKNKGPALRWVLASGYTSLRRELHRVEEALYSVESASELVGDVLHDDLSLEDSGLRNRFALRRVIRDALHTISPAANLTLLRPVPSVPPGASHAGLRAVPALLSDTDVAQGPKAKGTEVPRITEAEARQALREVRFAINDYRDDIMDSFALGRNKLIWTFLAVALTTYALVGLGLLIGIPKTALVSVSVLYLVASVVGLFNRLRIESSRSSTVEDYGLYLARLVTGALLSGLAGVAGVYLIAQAPAFLAPLTTTSTNAVGAVQVVPAPKNLADVYNLTTNELALFIAAVFGLAPGTLTSRLQQQVDRLERDLQRSEPATSKTIGGATSSDEEAG